ncbi:MAG: NUDIX hydrolase [Methanobacterium sp.]|nr:NUDIX hydrolase [Methanobacterium sp.]
MKSPFLTVDTVVVENASILLIKRKNDPYQGSWALPGGFVEYGETVENAAVRETKEETGIVVKLKELVGVYSDPDRDPRGHTVTVCFLGVKIGGMLESATDADDARYFDLNEIKTLDLAFDHERIIQDSLKLLKI